MPPEAFVVPEHSVTVPFQITDAAADAENPLPAIVTALPTIPDPGAMVTEGFTVKGEFAEFTPSVAVTE
jgi:hypothetical protein